MVCLHIVMAPAGQAAVVQEYLLTPQPNGSSQWVLQRDKIRIEDKAVFAPANLRATAENEAYQKLVQHWMSSKYTLRYSGGMVPDVHHILTKVWLLSTQTLSRPAVWPMVVKMIDVQQIRTSLHGH